MKRFLAWKMRKNKCWTIIGIWWEGKRPSVAAKDGEVSHPPAKEITRGMYYCNRRQDTCGEVGKGLLSLKKGMNLHNYYQPDFLCSKKKSHLLNCLCCFGCSNVAGRNSGQL